MARSCSQLDGGEAIDDAELRRLMKEALQSTAVHVTLTPEAVSKLLACNPSDLIELASRRAAESSSHSDVLHAFLHELVEVLAAMDALTNSIRRAAEWIRTAQLREFAGQTPIDLVAGGRGRDVRRLVEIYDAGPAG